MATDLVVRIRGDVAHIKRALGDVDDSVDLMGRAVVLGAAAAGGALVGLGVSSVRAAISFESAFAGIRKTVDATEAEFGVLSKGIREMAKEVPIAVGELAKIAESAGQLGIAKEGILAFTRVVADLAATTDLTADAAANALARIANIMGTAQSEFSNLGSTIVALGNAGASTESEIVDFGLRIAGAGKIVGLTESAILSIASTMASLGIEAEAGGTAVQKVLLNIDRSVVTSDKKLALFAKTAGMSAKDFATAWRTDPQAAFVAFVEGLGRSGKDAQLILDELDLTDQRLIRSFLSLAASGDLLRSTIELGDKAWTDNTARTEEARKRYETTAAQIEIAKNKLNDLKIMLGDKLLPVINEQVLPAFTHIIEQLGFVIEDTPQATKKLDELGQIFAGVGEAIKTVVGFVANFTAGVEILGEASVKLEPLLKILKKISDVVTPLGLFSPSILETVVGAGGDGGADGAASVKKNRFRRGFQSGGVVPGPVGIPQLALVHGGEKITPPGGKTSSMSVTIHISGAGDPQAVALAVRDELLRLQRRNVSSGIA